MRTEALHALVAMAAVAMGTTAVQATTSEVDASFGTLVRCEQGEGARCLWVDQRGALVGASEMIRQLMEMEQLDTTHDFVERRRLENHVQYIEDVHRHALERGLTFSYRTGVNARHLYLDHDRHLSAREFVDQEFHAHRRRRLEEEETASVPASRKLEGVRETLDWCSTDNSYEKSICTPIKSQSTCGSCWAFAATDAIETAVVVSGDGKDDPRALSPQQFLDCSTREMTSTFDYCWAEGGVGSAPWLQTEMTWSSDNNACDGGMTHGAFDDAAHLRLNLLSQLDLPYTETTTEVKLGLTGWHTETSLAEKNDTDKNVSCSRPDSEAAASISDWTQVVGKDCSSSSDATELLKIALQKQPISVAINSGSSFKDYKGGVYQCPNNGDFPDSSTVDHAVVLVGYGKEDSTEYWILKNSYSSLWGEKGFVRIAIDKKINCGINIFPVIPLGAKAGASPLIVDGGGDMVFVGLSPTAWIGVAIGITVGTVVLTMFGIGVQKRRRAEMHKDPIM